MRNWIDEVALFSNKLTTGTTVAYPIKDFEHIMLALSSSWSANFTIKFQWSFSDEAPTFSSAQSATNRWDYIDVKDIEDGASIDGDTGVAFVWADDVRLFELWTPWLKWVWATITALTAWSVNLGLTWYNW